MFKVKIKIYPKLNSLGRIKEYWPSRPKDGKNTLDLHLDMDILNNIEQPLKEDVMFYEDLV